MPLTRHSAAAGLGAGTLELEQFGAAASAPATRSVPRARHGALTVADHLVRAGELALTANVTVGEHAAHHVVHAGAVAANDIAHCPGWTQNLAISTAVGGGAIEDARALLATSTV